MPERQQAAEVLVSSAILAEERDPAPAFDVELRAHQRAQALAARDGVEARDPVEAPTSARPKMRGQRRRRRGKVFGERGGAQEEKALRACSST